MTDMTIHNHDLARVGLEAATFLTNHFKESLIYEKMAEFIFQKMNKSISLNQICFYVIDDEMENIKEEAIYNKAGWMPSYDFISLDQIPSKLSQKKILRTSDNHYNYLKVPLHTGSQLLGLIEFRTISFLDGEVLAEVKALAKAISLGLRSVLFEKDTIKEKENTEFSIRTNYELQSIDELDLLINRFLKMTVNYYRFDRVVVFIFNEEKEVVSATGIDEMGRKFTVHEFPEMPDLSADYITIDDNRGYWFPLKTNTGIVGVVLFDNHYTLYKISESIFNTLRTLSSQFANAIDNIRMFSSLQKSAYVDSLTTLHNRNYLEEVLPKYNRQEVNPLSIIIGDLNGLKITNDVFGHGAGDSLLRKTADILKESCPEDEPIFRWGGDEFLVLLPGKTEDEAHKKCQIIKEKCSKNNDTQVQLSISLGYATRKNENEKLTDLMKRAEDRMYRHKLLESKNYRNSIISSLKERLAEKSHESAGHIERMTTLAIKVGKEIGLMGSELEDLRLLAMLHDLGKVTIDGYILNKAASLNDKEWEEIKKHPEAGYRIAQASMELSHISNYILNHHEWWNGNGYPLGKKGKEIPLLSRIISVVDAYDVMTHKRPYKEVISYEEAVKELDRCAGTQFDPDIVNIFQSLICK